MPDLSTMSEAQKAAFLAYWDEFESSCDSDDDSEIQSCSCASCASQG